MRTVIDLGVALAERAAAENWIDVLKAGEWQHEAYGKVKVTVADLHKFKANFDQGTRGVDLAVDVSHEPDKGAVGWFKELKVVGDTLRARVAWTEEGAELIRSGKFRYFSPEFAFEYTHNDGRKFRDVLLGGALTNRPFLKELAPVELSEDAAYALLFARKGEPKATPENDPDGDGIPDKDDPRDNPDADGDGDPADDELDMAEDEHANEMSEWSTADVNDFPDSSFAYISPGGTKDSEGKTTPRSKRHLPYKDAEGKVDAPHVRNALARLNQTQIPAEAKAKAKRKLIAAARSVGVKVAKKVAAAEQPAGDMEPRDGVGSPGRKPDDRDAGRYSDPGQGGASRMADQNRTQGAAGTAGAGGAGNAGGQGAQGAISLAEHQAALDRIKLLEDQQRRARFGDQVRGWMFDERTRKGRLTPAVRDKVIDFQMTLTEDQAKAFAEIIEALPPAVDFGEHGVSHSAEGADKEASLIKLTEEIQAKNPGWTYRQAMEAAADQLQLSEV